MSSNVTAFISFLTVVIVIGLIVRFHTGASDVLSAGLGSTQKGTGLLGIISAVENPGNLETKVS